MSTDSRTTVLLVDDNPDLLVSISESLEAIGGFHVITAENGAQALERFFAAPPDCVIIDVKMPTLDGLQLARALRGDTRSRQTPLIMLTAMAQERDQLAGYLSGADYYLLKPVPPRDLVTHIHTALALNDEERQSRLRALTGEVTDGVTEGATE